MKSVSLDNTCANATPDTGVNVRSVLHEYGGGSYSVFCQKDGTASIIATTFGEKKEIPGGATVGANAVCVFHADGSIDTVIPPVPEYRYGNFAVHVEESEGGGERVVVYCIREDHGVDGKALPSEVINTIVRFTLPASARGFNTAVTFEVIQEGADFYSSLDLSGDGRYLSFIEWDHPNMPWDSTMIREIDLTTMSSTIVHGKEDNQKSSNTQPKYSPDNTLYFLSDVDDSKGCYDLYSFDRSRGTSDVRIAIGDELVAPGDGWTIGLNSYGFVGGGKGKVVSLCNSMGGDCCLVVLDLQSGEVTRKTFEKIDSMSELVIGADNRVLFLGGSYVSPPSLWSYDLTDSDSLCEVFKSAQDLEKLEEVTKDFVKPTHMFYGGEADSNSGVHAYLYTRPQSPSSPLPPLLVKCHGGPTSSTSTTFRLDIQYWTTRGFTVLDVDYRGSSGYGKFYRRGLLGKRWGKSDVDDVCNGAKYLVEKGLVDPQRIAIDGGSAGGYTTLCALVFRDTFTAGCSKYGISDLASLSKETHKFESCYMDKLIGKLPEDKDIFDARCPILHLEKLSCPVILLQGTDDVVVPPNQATMMFHELRKKNIDSNLVLYKGETHGFRKAENICHALDAEYLFYLKTWKMELDGKDYGDVKMQLNDLIEM